MLRQAYVDGCPYKVAMIDFVMPDKNGMDLAREILADPAISSTKLILLTAFDAPGLASQTLNMGFSAYLTKPVRQSQMLESLINAISGTQSFGSATDEKSHEKREPIKPRKELILVAEDYVINQQVAQLYLDELGFASHIVSNGKQALEAASNKPYSLILMDCQMPEMDGFTAAQAIRQKEEKTGQHIPIIAVTAHAMRGDRERCLEAGMDDYISKPIEPRALRKALEKWLPLSDGIDSSLPIDFQLAEARYGHIIEQLFRVFVEVTPAELAKLSQAVSIKNTRAILDAAHGLKGACSTVCALQMRDTCKEIEAVAKLQSWDQLESLRLRLEQEFAGVERCLLDHPAFKKQNN